MDIATFIIKAKRLHDETDALKMHKFPGITVLNVCLDRELPEIHIGAGLVPLAVMLHERINTVGRGSAEYPVESYIIHNGVKIFAIGKSAAEIRGRSEDAKYVQS